MPRYLIFCLLLCSLALQAQDNNMTDILQKRYAGEELTESEKTLLKQWEADLERTTREMNLPKTSVKKPVMTPTAPFKEPPLLTEATFLKLCKSVLKTYGDEVGASLPLLEHALTSAEKETDGADMGAGMMIQGAASASVYCIAWSALKNPKDILTINNLGAALLQAGDHTKALQVLLYAEKLRPDIGLILVNLGWAYRELGSNEHATLQFKKALLVAEEMTSPYLGLGLIAEEEENYAQARIYLRKALKDQQSEVGMAAYKQSKPKNPSSSEKPLSDQKSTPEGLTVPDLPTSESMEGLAAYAEVMTSHKASLEMNLTALGKQYMRELRQVNKREEEFSRKGEGYVVIPRDFAREKMLLDDIADQVFGENSRFRKALNKADTHNERLKKESETIMKRLIPETEKAYKTGDFSKVCVLNKQLLDISYEMGGKYYPEMARGIKEDIQDYYAYTDPVLARIYQPEYNQLYNTQRELIALSHHQIVANFGALLAQTAAQYSKIECNKAPESISQGGSVEDESLPDKRSAPCPLGTDGIKGGMGALSLELSCTHVKISGGEGFLWSVNRDFVTKETKVWGGIGARTQFGKGMLSGEASLGVEMTIGKGNAIKDVAFTSSVKAGVGGLLESEISGRYAIEGGPSIDSNAGFTKPSLPFME
jgi:tetratricopeptide (TPR) repeat protein